MDLRMSNTLLLSALVVMVTMVAMTSARPHRNGGRPHSHRHNNQVHPAAVTCDRDEFLCNATNDCIPMEWRCDGDADCDSVVINGVTMGEEDEQGCAEHVAALERAGVSTCDEDHFQCHAPGQGIRCVPDYWVCDGEADCEDESDEKACFGR